MPEPDRRREVGRGHGHAGSGARCETLRIDALRAVGREDVDHARSFFVGATNQYQTASHRHGIAEQRGFVTREARAHHRPDERADRAEQAGARQVTTVQEAQSVGAGVERTT